MSHGAPTFGDLKDLLGNVEACEFSFTLECGQSRLAHEEPRPPEVSGLL